jgi:hypothetical protein
VERLSSAIATGELPGQFDRIVQSWDTANKATELSDFSVHNLGSEVQGALPARRIPPAAGISGTQAHDLGETAAVASGKRGGALKGVGH